MMYFVNGNYKTTRAVVLSFEELLDKTTREHFACDTFVMIGEYADRFDAIEAFRKTEAEGWK